MSPGLLRAAHPQRDGAACAAIYAPAVADSAISFEESPAPDAAAMAARIAVVSRTHPWLVLEDAGRVVGYAYGSPHRSRGAYRRAVDVAVYVAADHRRRGAGRELYLALLERLRAQGFWIACAGIALPNDASVALHRAVGFSEVGTYRRIGWKAGAWRDVAWWQRLLGPRTRRVGRRTLARRTCDERHTLFTSRWDSQYIRELGVAAIRTREGSPSACHIPSRSRSTSSRGAAA